MFKSPPFQITKKIVEYIEEVCMLLGDLNYNSFKIHSDVRLRKNNNIQTIKSSLAIEGNSLSFSQVSDILNGERVIAFEKDIIEVKNAILVYELFDELNPFDIEDMLKAHKLLMNGLVEESGRFRVSGVGIFKEREVVHIAPPAKNLSSLISNLFEYLKKSDDSLLIKSCIFHYEFEFIHPFSDGNGRIGRLWQQLILSKMHPIFRLVCIEELLEKYQIEYYNALHDSDTEGSSEIFAEFMLSIIFQALKRLRSQIGGNIPKTPIERLYYAKDFIDDFKRSEYLNLLSGLSTSTASRDLVIGIKNGILEKSNSRNQTVYRFKKTK